MSDPFEDIARRLFDEMLDTPETERRASRQPVHVVYGGANLFSRATPQKFGSLALNSLAVYAPDFTELARAMWLRGADGLPRSEAAIRELEFEFADDPAKAAAKHPAASFAWNVHERVIGKLKTEPVEDFRIDFEDGYGIRTDEEEDNHAATAARELAALQFGDSPIAFCGFRVKSFQRETFARAVRTLRIFLDEFLKSSSNRIPANFVVTLPKINSVEEVAVLCELLDRYESDRGLEPASIGIEIMIETPFAVANAATIAEISDNRVKAAHFGAFDYTAAYGITADHQHLQHDACRFARQSMQLNLSPMDIRLADSVTIEMPVPIHRAESLSIIQIAENRAAVHDGWRRHFNNVTKSLINGFYQSWDLHPAQLVARYAALYAFFLESSDAQAARLRGFVGKATQAMMTGNLFDDAASAQGLLNFFLRAVRCGAMTAAEAIEKTGLSEDELRSASFVKIMDNRRR